MRSPSAMLWLFVASLRQDLHRKCFRPDRLRRRQRQIRRNKPVDRDCVTLHLLQEQSGGINAVLLNENLHYRFRPPVCEFAESIL